MQNDTPKYKRYWPVPQFIDRIYEYQDINKDPKLRKQVTEFFIKKVLKWIDSDSEFSKYNNKKEMLNSSEGHLHIYQLLRTYIKKYNTNWYDLEKNYHSVKQYLSRHL
jgi:hypothetical protein